MKTCEGCKYAEWQKTESGRLHPSGKGRCGYKYKVPALPASMYWMGSKNGERPYGGCISRIKGLPRHCPYYEQG